MALITCPECGKPDVSDTAKTCPNCGYDLAAHRQREEEARRQRDAEELELHRQRMASSGEWGTVIIIVVVVVIIAGAIFGSNQSPSTGTNLFSFDQQTTGITFNQAMPFKITKGKVNIAYTCTGKGDVQFNLAASTNQRLVIWQKQVSCPSTSKTEPLNIPTEMQYVITTTIHGKVTYDISVIQA